jgi:hypothetical protein
MVLRQVPLTTSLFTVSRAAVPLKVTREHRGKPSLARAAHIRSPNRQSADRLTGGKGLLWSHSCPKVRRCECPTLRGRLVFLVALPEMSQQPFRVRALQRPPGEALEGVSRLSAL